MLFGKNSDRQRNEAQAVEYFPAATYHAEGELTCTYIAIPQVRRTNAVLLCRPFWVWGAEMGTNEHGVVIGNEGLRARSPAPEEKALIGMDLIRLSLERANTAAEALDVMTTLLKRYGQGGDCGHLTPEYYNNGFIVADPCEAFILETVGREWLIERVSGVRAISNTYSIGRAPERISDGLAALVHDSGWSADLSPNYADSISNPEGGHIGDPQERRARATSLLRSREGHLSTMSIMGILRDHGPTDAGGRGWRPQEAIERTLCTHATDEARRSQTVGSMVSEVRFKNSVHWVTGTAAPCISIFKPVLLDVPMPSHGAPPTDRFDHQSLWWRHEALHRAAVLGDFAKFLDGIRPERDAVEASFLGRVNAVLNGGNGSERAQVVAECWREAIETETRWKTRFGKTEVSDRTPHAAAWLRMNRTAGISVPL